MKEWSLGGQVYYLDGWAWGVNTKGKTVYMGLEKDIRKLLTEDDESSNPVIANIVRADRNNS